ncbi:MAG: lipoate protein ligase C-terminal domain-containing protein, partial [Candidatus Nanoarchaeia archaeon]
KVPGGKVVEIIVDVLDGIITDLQITGDFFVHPEEGIGDLERCLINQSVKENDMVLLNRINETVVEKELKLVGVTPKSIVLVLREALE